MMHRLLLIPAVLLALSLPAWASPHSAEVAAPKATSKSTNQLVEVVIPLPHGSFNAGEAVGALCDAAELPVDHVMRQLAQDMQWSFDLASPAGRERLGIVTGLVDTWAGELATTELGEEELTISVRRDTLELLMQRAEPAMLRMKQMGDGFESNVRQATLQMIDAGGEHVPVDGHSLNAEAVILVHGLDSPGWVWKDLIGPLQEAGHNVFVFNYPDDGPIADSADMLALTLMDLKVKGVDRVNLVAHSMGGLVSRDVLTRLVYYNSDGAATERLPAVDRLIMLGTPNHGSQLARMRNVKELYESIANVTPGGAPNDDGGGEAAADLLPGSSFLQRLNRRPHPSHTTYTIVAGLWAPIDTRGLKGLADRARTMSKDGRGGQTLAGRFASRAGSMLADTLTDVADSAGDGAVSLKSAHLEGVSDFVEVNANHLSMLVQFHDDRIPPCIPVVIGRLEPATSGSTPTDETDPAASPN